MQMNQAQQKAVIHKDGPMLVLAGPGSGKTSVITERTKYLIMEHKVPEDQILVITFTKAAANEMKERFLTKMKVRSTRTSFGTFHAIFFMILKYAYRYDASNILREEVRFQMLKEIIHKLNLEYEDEKEFIMDISSEISLVKGDQINLVNYYSTSCANEVFQTIFREYEIKLRRSNLIDFDDMLILCYELLTQREDILSLWQNKYRYILVDEFQDINRVQYQIVKMLAKPRNNLFIVGDDDQSIYRFRGAKPEIMLNFPKDYPECKQIFLDVNYRSTGLIVEAAGRLINHNLNRFQKIIKTDHVGGKSILSQHFETLTLENKALADEILKLSREGICLSDIAILVRTNLGSGALLHKLMEYNIPFQMKDNLPNLYDHWITKDLLTYMQIAKGNSDRSLFLQIINKPKRYISREVFDNPSVDLDAIKDYYEDKQWMLERIDQLEYDLALLSNMNPFAAINYIRKGVGYEDYLKEYADQRHMKAGELLDILDEVQEGAKDFKSFEEWINHMEQYKDELKRQMNDNRSKHKDSVTIATMHSSKGLEFQVVFIVDANEGITPHKKAVLPEDIEEERRLFYVAMTRAKEYLYLFSTKDRYNKTMERSRFLKEIEEQSICK